MTKQEILLIALIREALGVNEKPMLEELPAIARKIKCDADRYEIALKLISEMTDIQTGRSDGAPIDTFTQAIKIINNVARRSLQPHPD